MVDPSSPTLLHKHAMQVFRGSQGAAQSTFGSAMSGSAMSGSAVAIGNFDGLHLGHQALFRRANESARANGLATVALTFDPHPARFFRPDLAPPLISTEQQKLELMAAHGIDAVVIERFDRALARMPADAFIGELLLGRLRARHVVVGHGFVFGYQRTGTVETLRASGRTLAFETHQVPLLESDSIVVSSTKIREFILMGRVAGATRLLGRPHFVDGMVVTGAGRGRTIGVPTANLLSENELLPGRGVYAGHAVTQADEVHQAVINVGVAPTFGQDNGLRVEAHLLDFTGNLVGQGLRLRFIKRLREEKRFADAQALVAAIKNDMAQARRALRDSE